MGEFKRGFWRAQLRSHGSRPLQLVKQRRAPCNSLRIVNANEGPTIMETMSSSGTSSNKREEAMVSADGRAREERKNLVMQAVTNTNRGKVLVTETATDEHRQHILVLLQELKGLNPTADPVNPAFSGRWALLYTTLIDGY